MTFDFNKLVTIGFDKWKTAPFRFYGEKEPFMIGGGKVEPSWQDIILSGNTALTLVNSKANGLNYLKLFGKCEQKSVLPDEFQRVEYLETDGNQYIDTGILLNNTDEFEITFQSSKNALTTPVMGAISGGTAYTSTNNISVIYNLGSKVNAYSIYNNGGAGDPNYAWNGGDYKDKLKHTIKYTGLDTAPTIDGEAMTQITSHTISVSNASVTTWLFGRNNTSTGTKAQDGLRIYDANFFSKGHFITCRRKSDSVLGVYDTVSGNFFTNAGTGTFTAGSALTTPTPDTPMDIICNNGAIKVRNKSGLPLGYQKIEYLQSDGACYIDTGVVVDTAQMTYKFRLNNLGTSKGTSFFGTENKINGPYSGVLYSNTYTLYIGTNTVGAVSLSINKDYILEIKNNTYTVFENGISIKEHTYDGTTITNLSLYIFANHDEVSGAIQKRNCGFEYFQIYKNDVLVSDLIPCRRNSDSVLGMYDTVTGNFLTNQDTGTFTAGADVDDMEIYTDGTVETVEVDTTGGTATAEMLLKVGDYQDVQSVLGGEVTRNVGIKVLDGTENWQMGQTFYVDNLFNYSKVAKNIPFCTHYKGVKGDTTATDYLNTNSIRLYSSSTNRLNIFAVMSDYADVNEFKQYLADQYANGTPVIIVYPLATPTTETVTAQPMNIQAGTNVITAEGSIDNLLLEVSYKAGVSVTITEVQNANLSNQVTVTIGG